MRFIALRIENFKSYTGSHVFDFIGGRTGLHFITGENQLDPGLGPNGCGKSSIFDALYWCLFGKTLRGLKAGNVRCWYARGKTLVSLQFEHGGVESIVTRAHSPNSLSVSSAGDVEAREVDQLSLEKFLGFDGDTFKAALLVPQSGTSFFDLLPSAKLALFSDILGLEYWVKKSEKASATASFLERERNSAAEKVAGTKGRLEEVKNSIAALEEQERDYKKERRERLQQLDKSRDTASRARQEHREALKILRHRLVEAGNVVGRLGETVNDLVQGQHKHRSLLSALEADRAAANERVRLVGNEEQRFQNVKDQCPYCNQAVSKAHLRAELSRIQRERTAAERALEKIMGGISERRERLTETERQLRSAQNELQKAETVERDLDRKVQQGEIGLDAHEETIRRIEHTIEVEADKPNPYARLIEDAKLNEIDLNDKLKKLTRELEAVEYNHAVAQFWAKGFKELRLFLIEEALGVLEVEVNNSLIQLGLNDWSVTFDVERETKSQTISKGFQVFIQSPDSPQGVPWEVWSGGETCRLKAAGTIGLMSLTLARKAINSNIEVWDEPTAGLGGNGLEDLLDLLATRAAELDKQIYIIDHHSIDYGGFTSVTTVVKDSNGSNIYTR